MATFESEFKAFRESLFEGTYVTKWHIHKLEKLDALHNGDYKKLYEMEVAEHKETERLLRGEIKWLKTPGHLCAAPAGNWNSPVKDDDNDSYSSMPPLEAACCAGETIWPSDTKKDHLAVLRALLKEPTQKEREESQMRFGILRDILENQRKAQEKIPDDNDELYQ